MGVEPIFSLFRDVYFFISLIQGIDRTLWSRAVVMEHPLFFVEFLIEIFGLFTLFIIMKIVNKSIGFLLSLDDPFQFRVVFLYQHHNFLFIFLIL